MEPELSNNRTTGQRGSWLTAKSARFLIGIGFLSFPGLSNSSMTDNKLTNF